MFLDLWFLKYQQLNGPFEFAEVFHNLFTLKTIGHWSGYSLLAVVVCQALTNFWGLALYSRPVVKMEFSALTDPTVSAAIAARLATIHLMACWQRTLKQAELSAPWNLTLPPEFCQA
jgi:hypothetical protein